MITLHIALACRNASGMADMSFTSFDGTEQNAIVSAARTLQTLPPAAG
jgi:ketopantoate hydroxymethyltransferase